MSIAGIWGEQTYKEKKVQASTMLTCEPNKWMSKYHDRMPVILNPVDTNSSTRTLFAKVAKFLADGTYSEASGRWVTVGADYYLLDMESRTCGIKKIGFANKKIAIVE